MERLTYSYVSEVSSCFGKPLSVLQGLKPAGLNEKVCAEVLDSLSKKRSRSGNSEETFSEDADDSKEAGLEGSALQVMVALRPRRPGRVRVMVLGASKPSIDV
ncbi:hypothetical protein Hdeb2414_s0004g00128291 [Helianthus debilis subsp. tardiflorus]